MELSVVIITKNAEDVIEDALNSVCLIASEVIVVDDFSTDKTLNIAEKYGTTIIRHHEQNFGKQKQYALTQTSHPWVLILDSDERVTPKLASEIIKILSRKTKFAAFRIPYQNHFLNKVVKRGGENYKMVRLFNKKCAHLKPLPVHEHVHVGDDNIGQLKNKIAHYSYRSIPQMIKKFTKYAIADAIQKKRAGERISFSKLFLYAPHMFYSRFIKDNGYKDGLFRIPLDLGFAYMELLTYWLLPFVK